ncbi:MAG TPA: efflux RND transporter permease subunit [Blastococcus sp.]
MRLRRIVVAGVVAVLGLGFVQLQQAIVDIYPEFKPTQVQIQTEALGLSTIEVESLITVPLEQNLLVGIPRADEVRSRSMPGLSVVDVTFEPGTDPYLARQLVQERLTRVRLLPHVGNQPIMVQPTASLGRVAMIGLRSETVPLVDMSVLARWRMRPQLMSIPGVANVSIWGLRDRQLQVQVDPDRLVASNVTLTQLIDTTGNALWVSPLSFVRASSPGTGGFFESPNQRIGVQHVSPVTSADQLADLTVPRADAPPVRLGDVATVTEDHQPLIGDATTGGAQGLMLVVERFPGADTAQVTRDVEAALAAMAPGLTGITVDPTVFRPASYLDSALGRLGLAVLIGLILMVAVIAAVTLSWRVTLVTFGAVAVSLVAALWVLHLRGSTLTTMTVLGLATVLALVVEDAVGDVAAMRARFEERRDAGRSSVAALAAETLATRRGGLTYATVAVLVALAPLLLLAGRVAAFARPALLTFVLAVLASLAAALVVTPTLAALLLGGTSRDASRVGRFPGWVRRGVDRFVAPSVGRRFPAVVALVALVALALTGIAQLRPGQPLPVLQDRSVLVRLEAAPGTSLTEMDRITGLAAAELRTLPGVESAGTHVGRAVGADSVVDVDSSQIWVTLGGAADQAGTLAAVRATVAGYPGLRSEVQTYAEVQLAAADTAPGDGLVVRVSGQNLTTIRETADQVREALATVEGVITPIVEVQPVQPVAEVKVDLPAAQLHGLQPGDIRRAVSTLVSGLTVGSLYEQQAIFDVVVWGGPAARHSVHDLESVRVDTPSGVQVPLGTVADVIFASDPAGITHHDVSRSLAVSAQIQGRDHDDVARDVTSRLQRLNFPYQYTAEVVSDGGGAGLRPGLVAAVAVAALLVFLLFQAATSNWRGAAVLFVCGPLAGAGGLFAALLLGEAGSVPVLAGVFAVAALAVRQVLVLVRRARGLAARGGAGVPVEAMRRAVTEQAPTVLAAVLVTAAAFLPAAVMMGGAGLEILHPFAVTLLAGLITSTAVVLFVVPALYPAVGALRSSGGVDDDPFSGRHEARDDGEPTVTASMPVHLTGDDQPGRNREAGSIMRISRSWGIGALLVAAGLALTGCQTAAHGTDVGAVEQAAVLVVDEGGGPGRITLSAEAGKRLGIVMTAVGPARSDGQSGVIPYGGVVYDNNGAAWAFVRIDERTYQRAPITVADIVGDEALLSSGPPEGAEVVTVGAAELVGVEAGISGGE